MLTALVEERRPRSLHEGQAGAPILLVQRLQQQGEGVVEEYRRKSFMIGKDA